MANKLVLDIGVNDKGTPALKDLQMHLDRTGKKAQRLGGTLKKVFASAVMVQGLILLKQATAGLVDELLKYEKSLKQIQAISKSSIEDMKKYNDMMLKISNTSEHTAVNIGKAGVALSKMGFSTKESLGILPEISDLATASLTDMDTAMETLGTTMRAFGLDATYTNHIVDVFQETINNSPQVLEDYKMAMSVVAPVAKAMGVSLLETSSMVERLAEAGLKGTVAGNTLKNTFLNIMTPSKEIKKVLEKNNYEFKNFMEVLKKLEEAGIPLPEVLDTFNKRAVTGVALMMKNAEATQEFTDKLENVRGVAKETAAVMRGALIIQLQELLNAFINTGHVMYQAMQGSETKSQIHNLTDSLVDLQEWVQNNTEDFKAFADNVKRITNVMGQLASFISTTVVKNFDLLSYTIGFYASAKMLKIISNFGLLNLRFSRIVSMVRPATVSLYANQKALNLVSVSMKGAASSVWTLGTAINAAIPALLAIELGVMAINKAFDSYNKKVDEASRKTNSMDLKSIDKRLDALTEYKLELEKIARLKKENQEYLDGMPAGEPRDQLKRATAHVYNQIKATKELQKSIAKKYGLEIAYLKTISDIDKKLHGERINYLKAQEELRKKHSRLTQHDLIIPNKEDTSGGSGGSIGWKHKIKTLSLESIKPQLASMPKLEDFTSPEVLQHKDIPLIPKFNPFTDSSFRESIEEYKMSVKDVYASNEKAIASYEEKMTQVYKIEQKHIDDELVKLNLLKKVREDQITDLRVQKSLVESYDLDLSKLKSPKGKKREDGTTINGSDKEVKAYQNYYNKIIKLKQNAVEKIADIERFKRANDEVIKNTEKMYADWQNVSDKTLTDMEKNIKGFGASIKEMQEQDFYAVEQSTKERNESIKAYFEEQAQATYDAVNMTITMVQSIYDQKWDRLQAQHKKEMELITIRKKHSISQAKDSIYKQEILSRYWENQQTKMKERQLKEDKELRKKQKAMDIVSAVVNTAVGVTASLKVGMPLGAILAAATAVAGATQIALIASQNYRRGGFVDGRGGATSDSIPANLSRGEFVVPADVVSNIGANNLEQMLDDRVDVFNSPKEQSVSIFVENFIGQEEFAKDMAVSVSQELQRMY
jgi:TP901 family phage tail tape measure protein